MDERISELQSDFKKALTRLEEALNEKQIGRGIVVDAVVKRFEFTFELSWKLCKRILAHQGVDAPTPRSVIKEAFKARLITDGDGWIDMLEDRNRTSHVYNEDTANQIYKRVQNKHYPLLKQFLESL